MLIYAHRGASASSPENTLLAFAEALQSGAEGIELDVQLTADRVPVVLHDRDVTRTTNGSGAIDRLTFSEVRNLNAGIGERVPPLAEVLDLVGDRIHLDVEIKQSGIAAETLDVLKQFPRARWAISSFDWLSLERTREIAPEAELWLLSQVVSDALFTTARRIDARAISLCNRAYTPAAAEQLRSAGLDAVVWTVNDPNEARRCRHLGAHGLCTDRPAEIIAALSSSS